MVYFKTNEEIELLRESSLTVSRTLAEVGKAIRPGMPTSKLDELAETFIRDTGAVPGFKDYRGFPYTLCISVNEQVVHGMPGEHEIADGDIISVDCGVLREGFYGDSAYTFMVGEVAADVQALLHATKTSLYLAIDQAVAGNRLGDIGWAVQEYCERKLGYGVVRELVGHGIGRELHEAPEVPNYGKRGRGLKLQEGLVIAIEPMVNMGKRDILQGPDGWTISTADGKPSAHFEHSVAVRKGAADILSTFEWIEEAELANPELGRLETSKTANV